MGTENGGERNGNIVLMRRNISSNMHRLAVYKYEYAGRYAFRLKTVCV